MFRASSRPGRRVRVGLIALFAVSLAVALAACGGSSSGGSGGGISKGATITIADVAPFTGPDAARGPTYLVSCDAAVNAINNAGGVLGHKLACKSVDTRGDPADAVPAVRQMYAS